MPRTDLTAIRNTVRRAEAAGASVVPLTVHDHDAILGVLLDDGGYAVRVNGHPADDADVAALLTERPPGVVEEDLHVLGLWVGGELVGVASLVVGWPETGTTHLGLLQLRADHQGRGLADTFHSLLRQRFPGRWRLSVVDSNARAIPFWKHLGYRETGVSSRWTSASGIEHEAIQMEG